jgi:heptosyltransferase-2
MMQRNLVIKKGATGDVVRTTVLLHLLPGHTTWVTDAYNRDILPRRHPALRRILSMDEAGTLADETFDRVVSLDDEPACARLASSVRAAVRMGTYWEEGRVQYTDHFAPWFDMSLVSRFGKEKADALKLANRKSYQAFLYEGFGAAFDDGAVCLVNEDVRPAPAPGRVGIEARAGARWPTKAWNGYDGVARALEGEGYRPFFFGARDTLPEYLRDIAGCALVLTGDTLAMHVALALGIPTVAVFTCTSPWEIHGYSIMEKVVSPQLEKAFYKTDYVPEAVDAVSVDDVLAAFHRLAERVGKMSK